MKINYVLLLFWVIGFFISVSCQKKIAPPAETNIHWECNECVSPRDGRNIGFDILDATESGSFENNFVKATELNINFLQLAQPWNAYESAMGIYDGPAVANLTLLNSYALMKGVKLSILINPIDIPGRLTPSYLSAVKFDNSLMVNAFSNLIDHLFTNVVTPANVIAFSVGNEINSYNWEANNDTPSEYQSFFIVH